MSKKTRLTERYLLPGVRRCPTCRAPLATLKTVAICGPLSHKHSRQMLR